jgi:hypothetical protein
MDNEKSMELRDQLALSILNGLLSHSSKTEHSVESILNYLLSKDEQLAKNGLIPAEELVRISYALADIMRKIRMSAFE